MTLRFHQPDYETFINNMRRFYAACQLDDQTIDQLIDKHEELIKQHLNATPELIARKIYTKVFDEYIN